MPSSIRLFGEDLDQPVLRNATTVMDLLLPFFIPLRRLALALGRFGLVMDKAVWALQASGVVGVVVARGIENRGKSKKYPHHDGLTFNVQRFNAQASGLNA